MLYRKLDVWQRSRLLSISVYREMATCRDYGFKDQITRSALSVPSNIAEGCERRSLKERKHFFAIAKGSNGEFATQADIGSEVGFVAQEVAARWQSEALQISRMLGALIKSLEQ